MIDGYDEVPYLYNYHHQQTNQSQQTILQIKVIQQVVSTVVSKLNNALMNKKQEGQIQFFSQKKYENRTKKNGFITLINSS